MPRDAKDTADSLLMSGVACAQRSRIAPPLPSGKD
jgi:hypothetical protein